MSVVGLSRSSDLSPWSEPACHPKRFEIGHGAAAAQMAQMGFPAEHTGELRDGFLFHRRACTPAVQGVVVGIDPKGQRVSQAGDGMGRLEHLAGIEWVEVGEIV